MDYQIDIWIMAWWLRLLKNVEATYLYDHTSTELVVRSSTVCQLLEAFVIDNDQNWNQTSLSLV